MAKLGYISGHKSYSPAREFLKHDCGTAPGTGAFVKSGLRLLEKGFGPIPENRGIPTIQGWSDFYDTPRTDAEIRGLGLQNMAADVSVLCGYNGLIASDLDTDDPEIARIVSEILPAGAPGKVGEKGETRFFRWEGLEPVPSLKLIGKDGKVFFEILGDGHKTTIPPSKHRKTNREYRWTDKSLTEVRAQDLPVLTADHMERLKAALQPWCKDLPSWQADDHKYQPREKGLAFSDAEQKRYDGYAKKALNERVAALAGRRDSRPTQYFHDVCYLAKWIHHGLVDRGEVFKVLTGAMERNGATKKIGRRAVFATFQSGLRMAANDPLPLLDDRPEPGPNGERPNEEARAAGAGDAWLEPEPLVSKVDPEPYPLDALPETILAAVKEVVAFVKAPLPMVASSSLTAISLAIQAFVDVRRDEQLLGPVSLFALTIGESGERKSAVDKMLSEALEQYQDEQAKAAKLIMKEYKAALDGWQSEKDGIRDRIRATAKESKPTEELKQKLKDHEQSQPLRPRIPKLKREDTTPEGLAKKLQTDWPSAGVMSNEAGIVFGAHGMGSESIVRNMSLLNKLWDGGRYQSDRSDDDRCRDVKGARLTMGLMVQEAVMREFFRQSKGLARSSGFVARFLIAWPKSTMGTRFYEPPASGTPALTAFNERLGQILAQEPSIDEDGALHPNELQLYSGAKKAWIEYHDDVEAMLGQGGELYDVKDVAAKSADNAARLAALFAYFERGASAKINENDFRRASQIALWHLNEARRFLGEFSMPEELANAARLEDWMIEHCRKGDGNVVSRREIQRCGPYGLRDKAAIDAALAELNELGRAREVKTGKKRDVHINPAILRRAK